MPPGLKNASESRMPASAMLPSPAAVTLGLLEWASAKRTDSSRMAARGRTPAAATTMGRPRNISSSRRAAGASIRTVLPDLRAVQSASDPPSRTHPAPAANTPASCRRRRAGRRTPGPAPRPRSHPSRDAPAERRPASSAQGTARPTTQVASPNASSSGDALRQGEGRCGMRRQLAAARRPRGQARRRTAAQEQRHETGGRAGRTRRRRRSAAQDRPRAPEQRVGPVNGAGGPAGPEAQDHAPRRGRP